MKRTLLTFALLSAFVIVKGQPSITDLSFPSSVSLFQKYEISFKLGQYSNPYDPDTISVYAVFSGPGNRCDTVIGFYYEGYTFSMHQTSWYEIASRDLSPGATGWRIRFTPDAIGAWSFCIHAIDRHGETKLCSYKNIPNTFYCLSVSNANGFITKANTRYLKRDVVKNNHRQYDSFFPVGINVAWYYCHNSNPSEPYGIYYYKPRIDSLSGNCNYMRIWLNRYQYLNLYGPEYTHLENGNPVVYFDSLVNQKDAAELDEIITYANQNDISLMLCFFAVGDFNLQDPQNPGNLSVWENNPYNTILHLDNPCDFFTNTDAKRITRNLIRYIIARWGYATNVLSWELWNEVTHVECISNDSTEANVLQWHKEMIEYIKTVDPFDHPVTSSIDNVDIHSVLYYKLFDCMDIAQQHRYRNIQCAESSLLLSHSLYKIGHSSDSAFSSTPNFIGEFGLRPKTTASLQEKDSCGVDLHNSLWSSLFSSSMGPASFWWWDYVSHCRLYKRFKPVFDFCKCLPIPSDSFKPYTTAIYDDGHFLEFANGIAAYYLKNHSEDTIYGWCQDTAFSYQSLRRLTDNVEWSSNEGWHFSSNSVFDPNGYIYTLDPLKKPQPSSNSNSIKIPVNKPWGTHYTVHWYNSETGLEYNNSSTNVTVQQNAGGYYISISFPSSIRDLNTHTIHNTFGDAVFAIYYNYEHIDPHDDKKQ